MLRYQLIESLTTIILYLYFFSLIDLDGLIRKAYREVFDRFVYDLVTLAVIIDPIGTAAIFAALSQSTPPGGVAQWHCAAPQLPPEFASPSLSGARRCCAPWASVSPPFRQLAARCFSCWQRTWCSHTHPGCGSRPEPRPTRRNAASIYPSSPSQSPDRRAGGADLAGFADASGRWCNRGTSSTSLS